MYLFKLFKISSLEAAADPKVPRAAKRDPISKTVENKRAGRFVLARGG